MRESHRYSRGERAADALVHALGLSAAIAGCAGLAAVAPPEPAGNRLAAVALGVYAAGLLAMLGCSTLYNLAGEGPRKALLRRLDHAAIFAMIAGTYTPIALLAVGGAWGWGLLAVVWAGAAGGAALKLLAGSGRLERASIGAYLLLGWAGLAALDPLLAALPPRDLALLLVGGLLYSLGAAVHLWTRLRYHKAIWHALVLAAAACHYAVVLRLAASG